MHVENRRSWHHPLTGHKADVIGRSPKSNWGQKTVIFLANTASLPAQILGMAIFGTIAGVANAVFAAIKDEGLQKGFAEGAKHGSAAGILVFSTLFFPLTLVSLGLARTVGEKGVRLRANLLAHKIFRENVLDYQLRNKELETDCRRLVRRKDRPFTDREQEILQNVLRYIARDRWGEAKNLLQPLIETNGKADLIQSIDRNELKKLKSNFEGFPVQQQEALRDAVIAGLLCNVLRAFWAFVEKAETPLISENI